MLFELAQGKHKLLHNISSTTISFNKFNAGRNFTKLVISSMHINEREIFLHEVVEDKSSVINIFH